MVTLQERQELAQQLEVARDKLDRFERTTINRRVIRRLRYSRPLHPLLLFRSLTLLVSGTFAVGAVAVMVASMVSRDIAVLASRIEASSMLPLPFGFGLLAIGGLLFALTAHLALLVVGRSAPLLPAEAKELQRLVSDVKRIEATMAVQARLPSAPDGSRDV